MTRQSALVLPPLPPSDQAYRWRVRRFDVQGREAGWSDFGRFFVDTTRPTLLSPAAGASLAPNGVVLRWAPLASAATAATSYAVEIRASNGQSLGSVPTLATGWAPTATLASGNYTWTVTAYDSLNNVIGVSDAQGFTVDAALRVVTNAQIQAPDGTGIGKTLTSTPPAWSQSDVVMTYQWQRDGQAIGNATGQTYVLTVEDFNKVLTLKVIGRRPGYTEGVSVSNGITATAGGSIVPTAQPSITGTPKVGEVLRVSTGTWSVNGAAFTYQWSRAGVPIPGATGEAYQLKPEDAGKSVSATVLAKRFGYSDGAATAAPVSIPKMASTTAATLSTTRVKVGKRVKISVAVAVNGVVGPTGAVKIFDAAKRLKTLTLVSARNGQLMWRLPKLKKGKHKIKAVYVGNAALAGSKSKITKLFVVR